MIYLLGIEDTPERDASLRLRDALLRLWPNLEHDSSARVWLVHNAKCYGQNVSDIDVLLLAQLPDGYHFRPLGSLPGPGGSVISPESVSVRSLLLAIEVKDHPPSLVRFEGNRVVVYYAERAEDASEQSHRQRIALSGYVAACGLHPPRARALLWLRNLRPHEIPAACANVIGANLTANLLLETACRARGPQWEGAQWTLDAFAGAASPVEVAALFTAPLQPTGLDRKRMERIAADAAREAVAHDHLEADIGRRLILVRGRGGTGKTVLLLQLARRLYEQQGARVILLTYNNALVGDLRRIMALAGYVGTSVAIQTAYAFFGGLLRSLGVGGDGPGEEFEAHYLACKQHALERVRARTLGPADVARLRDEGRQVAAFDYVFVDEGQDWPDDERELLLRLFGPHRLIVADGVDQLVREREPADWHAGLDPASIRVVYRDRCLRMKANLSRFVGAFACALGVDYDAPTPNKDAPGGQVLVCDGDYFAARVLHDDLLRRVCAAGNCPVDMLFCVPPSLTRHTENGEARSLPARRLSAWGLEVWDGVDYATRRGVPTNPEQHRLVTYESCRGLEGWVTVCFGFDDFYEGKHRQARAARAQRGEPPDNDRDRLEAVLWTLIPTTRPMDTLVLHLSGTSGTVRAALEEVGATCRDFVEWRRV